ncbi:MFS transporter [Streptomyces sp. GS7]|uniref:MFS transporter n=1 Tax=Streptomyces sp. GS7 TaxID=2692234 RepID=UPI0013179A15|nr:MFS transporter [Streptomyces sp. GS7]QHC25632.1 MFS transporter [Streptomyces sp. GS7]
MAAVALGFVIALMSSAIKNTVSVFYVSMSQDFSVSRGTFAIAPSVFMLTYAIASPALGFAADRMGARRSLAGGLVLGGAMFLAGGVVSSFALFSVVYGVGLAIAYTAVSYVPLGVLVDELFPPHRRGLTYAILMNGTAVGFIALVPLWIYVEHSTSWRTVFIVLGVVMVALMLLSLLLLPGEKRAPEETARAAEQAGRATGEGQTTGGAGAPARGGMFGAVLRSPVFWTVSLAFVGCGVTMSFVDVHLVASLDSHGLGGGTASTTMAILGAAEIVGSLIAGYLCDRGHGLKVLAGCYLIRALSLVVMAVAPTVLTAWVFGLLFGISYMGTVVAGSMYLLNSLDPRAKGLALGMMWCLHQIGAFVASEAGGLSFDALHSYDPVVIGAAACAGLSFLIVVTALPKALRKANPTHA